MSKLVSKETWVWVVVQDPESRDAQIVGQQDDKNDISFIPAFLEKDEALKCYNLLTFDKNRKNEVQAVIYEELCRDASENGFLIFILNGEGNVQEKIDPASE